VQLDRGLDRSQGVVNVLHRRTEHGHEPVAGKHVAEDAAVALDHLPGRPEVPVEHGGEHLWTQPLAERGGIDQIAVQHRHDPEWLAWRVAHFGTGGRGGLVLRSQSILTSRSDQ
jgi:hypothetical protein